MGQSYSLDFEIQLSHKREILLSVFRPFLNHKLDIMGFSGRNNVGN